MIPDQLKKMFSLNSKQDVNMANNIWKMLDQMADSSPEQYKDFIQKNMKEGVQDVKTKKQQKQKPFRFKPQKGVLIQFDAVLRQKSFESQDSERSSVLQQKLDVVKEKWHQVKSKFKNKLHILLNVCFSDRVKLPLDKQKKQMKKISINNIRQIETFYYSVQNPIESQDKKQLDYCMILNKSLVESLIGQMEGRRVLMGLALSYFEQRLQNDKNPLLKLYNPQLHKKLAFYQIEKSTIKFNSKNYFYGGAETVQQILLEKQIDVQRVDQLKRQEQKMKEKKKTQEKKMDIRFKKQEENSNTEKQKQSGFLFKGNNNQSQQGSVNQKPKKPLIQVLEESTERDDQIISHEIRQGQDGYHVQFLVPQVQSINDLDLQINSLTIKLKKSNQNDFTVIKLKKAIDPDTAKAKLKKKMNRLILDVAYLSKN